VPAELFLHSAEQLFAWFCFADVRHDEVRAAGKRANRFVRLLGWVGVAKKIHHDVRALHRFAGRGRS